MDNDTAEMTGNEGERDATKATLDPERLWFIVGVLTPKPWGRPGVNLNVFVYLVVSSSLSRVLVRIL